MYKQDLCTDSGMWALWDYETYKDIDDYDKWEPLFCEDTDIENQIKRKTFVPINIEEDGCCSFTLKIDEELSDREQKYVCVKSDEYLFQSRGRAVLSGIEYIERDIKPEQVMIIGLPEGVYSVQVYLISWNEEPDAYLDTGDVNPEALSDFVVLIKSKADSEKTYRIKVNTFSEDD